MQLPVPMASSAKSRGLGSTTVNAFLSPTIRPASSGRRAGNGTCYRVPLNERRGPRTVCPRSTPVQSEGHGLSLPSQCPATPVERRNLRLSETASILGVRLTARIASPPNCTFTDPLRQEPSKVAGDPDVGRSRRRPGATTSPTSADRQAARPGCRGISGLRGWCEGGGETALVRRCLRIASDAGRGLLPPVVGLVQQRQQLLRGLL